jgi:hypothetical protein
MRPLVLVLFGFALCLQALASDVPVTVIDSGSKEVDALVLQLVSRQPAPHPSGYSQMTVAEDMAGGYMTAQVSNAIVKLKAMGPAIFPALVQHLRDGRYSFSRISSAWENLTVGDAVVEVLDDGHYMHSGYKHRKTPSGTDGMYLSFKDYLKARGPEDWADWAKDKTRLAIQEDFIEWCVVKEKARGFTDADQEKSLLATYQRARERVRKEYSEPDGPANGSQPIRSETNSTSSAVAPESGLWLDRSAAGSRR